MQYTKVHPAGKLACIVQFFWQFEGDFSEGVPYEHAVTASVFPKLAFQYQGRMAFVQNGEENKLFKSGFQSQTNFFHKLVAKQTIGVFGVYFHAYALPFLFNIPANEFTNQNIEISDLLGQEGKELEDMIFLCNTLAERVNTVTEFLKKKLSNNTTTGSANIVSAINSIVSGKGMIQVSELAGKHCLSQRQFERKFKQMAGFSPKMFSRIVRFEECISTAVLNKESLTETTYALGYYDQPHMIKDFREFSGQNPSDYFSEDISYFFG